MSPPGLLDLHLHSTLSPCGAAEMAPPAMLLTAERRGLHTVGVVDHSSAGNAAAFLSAAPAFTANVLVGLEIESAEGVHLLALFDAAAPAEDLSALVGRHLPPRDNRPDLFGEQLLVNEWGDTIGVEQRLLVAAADLSVERLAEETLARGGLSIAAHIDRLSNGLMPTLGIIPPRLRVDLFELSPATTPEAARLRWPELARRPLLSGSDAHYLEDIGRTPTRTPPELAVPTVPLRDWAARLAEALS